MTCGHLHRRAKDAKWTAALDRVREQFMEQDEQMIWPSDGSSSLHAALDLPLPQEHSVEHLPEEWLEERRCARMSYVCTSCLSLAARHISRAEA